jgi:phage shock protein E
MKNIFLAVFVLCFTISCQAQNKTDQADKVGLSKEVALVDLSIDQAKRMVEQGKNITIIDVRTPAEVAAGKINNAINIDYQANDFRTKLAALDKNGTYLVYCQAGGRSSKAVQVMKEMGFAQIFHMKDGYRAW